jgi:hypothetical protein
VIKLTVTIHIRRCTHSINISVSTRFKILKINIYTIIMNTVYTFIFINFIVSFISDIVLNDLSTLNNYKSLSSLAPYFKDKYIVEAGLYAGLTIVVVLVGLISLSNITLGYYIPKRGYQLAQYCCLAYILGYVIDVLIEKLSVFGTSLDKFYETVGSGHSGAIAFVFSIMISYFLQYNLLPLLIS